MSKLYLRCLIFIFSVQASAGLSAYPFQAQVMAYLPSQEQILTAYSQSTELLGSHAPSKKVAAISIIAGAMIAANPLLLHYSMRLLPAYGAQYYLTSLLATAETSRNTIHIKTLKTIVQGIIYTAFFVPLSYEISSHLQWSSSSYQQSALDDKDSGIHSKASPYASELKEGYRRLQATHNLQAQNYRDDFKDCIDMMERSFQTALWAKKEGRNEVPLVSSLVIKLAKLYSEVRTDNPLTLMSVKTYLVDLLDWNEQDFAKLKSNTQDLDPDYKTSEEYYDKLFADWSRLTAK